jgi:hypothetical protein
MFMKRQHTRLVVGPAKNRRRRPRRRRRCGIADFFNKAKVFKRSLPEDDDFLDDESATLGDIAAVDKLAIDVADYAEMEGRDGSDSCEIHINSDYIVGAIGLLAAGLAYITYVAITQGRRRKKRRSTDSIGDSAQTAVLLGMALVHYG